MLDVARQAGFLQETGLGVRVGASRLGEDLDRYGAANDRVARAVNFRHATAQILFEFVFPNARGKLQSQDRSPYERVTHRPKMVLSEGAVAARPSPVLREFTLVGQTIAFRGLPPSAAWQTTQTDRLPHKDILN